MNIMDNRYTLTRAGELSDELISIRRKIHQNPEIASCMIFKFFNMHYA